MNRKPPDETNKTTGGAAGGEGTAATPPAQTPAGAATPPATPPAQPPATPPAPAEIGADDEPQPGQKIVLTTEALNKRMSRASRAHLREVTGTDDPAEVKKRLTRLDELEKGETERQRAQLTKEQQLEADLAAERTARATAEARANAMEEDRQVNADGEELKTIAVDFIKPKFWKAAQVDLADHLADEYTPEQLDGMSASQREKVVRDFFEGYAKENPELAKAAPAAPPATPPAGTPPAGGQQTPPPARVPLKNGTANPQGKGANAKPAPIISEGKYAGKTLKPGQPNSMTAAEYADWKRTSGNNY